MQARWFLLMNMTSHRLCIAPMMVAMDGGKGVGMAGGPGDIREGAEPPFREVSNRKPVDAVKLLLEAGADANAKSDEGDTALHLAAFDGKLDAL